MQSSLSDLINRIITCLIKGLVILLPLFFLPTFRSIWTTEWLEFNKQYLLWLIVPLIIILWLTKMVAEREIRFKRTPLDIPILIFLAVTGAASIFSIDKFSSLFGYHNSFSHAWLSLLSLVLFYFVITNFINNQNIINILKFASLSFAIFIIISMFALFSWLGDNSQAFSPLPTVRLDYQNALSITSQTLQAKPLFGSGPGTFSYDFSLYRSADLNHTNLWQYRFKQSPSYILEIATTTGILGMLSYFLILSLFFYLIYIIRKKIFKADKKEKKMTIGLIIAITIVLLLQFIYPVNTTLLFLFWLLLALNIVVLRDLDDTAFKEVKIKLTGYKNLSRLLPIILLIIFSGWLVLFAIEIKYWLAEVAYSDYNNRETNLNKAIELNPHQAIYQVGLAKHYLNLARVESIKQIDQRNNQLIQTSIDKSINMARKAVATKPNSVITQETLAMIYRDVRLLTVGSELWAVSSFEQVAKLEPTNPVLWTELGKAYLNNSQLPEAVSAFKQALELKDDYYEAAFGLAKVYSKDKKEDQALVILDNLAEVVADPGVYFEQGRILYNQGEIDLAIEKFGQVLMIDPNHANAIYSLGLAYELQGDKDKALELFKQVLEFNPDNVEVMKKIEQLSW